MHSQREIPRPKYIWLPRWCTNRSRCSRWRYSSAGTIRTSPPSRDSWRNIAASIRLAMDQQKGKGSRLGGLDFFDDRDNCFSVQHAVNGIRGGHYGNLFLADPEEHEGNSLGARHWPDHTPLNYESTCLVHHRPHRSDRRFIRLSPRVFSRSIYSTLLGLVALGNEGQLRLGLGHVGSQQSIYHGGGDRRAGCPGLLHRDDFAWLWTSRRRKKSPKR